MRTQLLYGHAPHVEKNQDNVNSVPFRITEIIYNTVDVNYDIHTFGFQGYKTQTLIIRSVECLKL